MRLGKYISVINCFSMGLTEFLSTHITAFIDKTGCISVFVLMVMESMILPVPSEAVMPFAGFLIAEQKFTFSLVIIFSTAGSIVGSLISYWMGRYGGRPFIDRFGKYLLLDHDDLKATEGFFAKYGEPTIFICRFIPVVRHLISIPAGTGKMNLWKFSIYTIAGAGLWNAFLAACGFYLRKNWGTVMRYSHYVDIGVILILGSGIVFFIWKHLQKRRANG
jgi:membrane protein DedA with SNARE-associated domain